MKFKPQNPKTLRKLDRLYRQSVGQRGATPSTTWALTRRLPPFPAMQDPRDRFSPVKKD